MENRNKKWRPTKEEQEAYQKTVDETFELSDNAIKEIFENYKTDIDTIIDYYKFASKFFYLSPKNIAMVKKQMPDATYVQYSSQWKKLNAYPKKGTHGIKIIAHQKFKHIIVDKETVLEHQNLSEEQEELLRSSDAKYVSIKYYDASEEIRKIAYERKLKTVEKEGFGKGFVFDVSQTTYPEENDLTPFLNGIPDEASYFIYKAISSFMNEKTSFLVKEVKFDSIMVRGYFSKETNTICINDFLNDKDKNYVLLHEIGHALAHPENELNNKIENPSISIQKELEKDILSIMSLSMFGLELSNTVKEHFKDDFNNYVNNLENMQIEPNNISHMLQKMSINVMKKFNANAKELNDYLYEFDLNKEQDISLEKDVSEEVTLEENKLDEETEDDYEIQMGF